MKKYSNKINKIRSFALSLIFIGFVIMYGGIFFKENEEKKWRDIRRGDQC